MFWLIFVAGAILSWGAYGAMLHLGQQHQRPLCPAAPKHGRQRVEPGRIDRRYIAHAQDEHARVSQHRIHLLLK